MNSPNLRTLDAAGLEEEIKTSDGLVIVDCWAEWCGPCRAMEPALEHLAREGMNIVKVDIDEHPEVASRYSVMSVPTMLVFAGAVEIGRLVGARSAARLRSDIESIAGAATTMSPAARR